MSQQTHIALPISAPLIAGRIDLLLLSRL